MTGNGLSGRVFVGKGGIDLATTSENSDLHRHLVNSGYADEKVLNRITTGETTLAAVGESNQALIDLLREMTVESLYQIGQRGGDFEVHEGLTTPYASPKSFDLEALLQDVEERGREWAKVTELISDLSGALGLRRDLGDREEVTIKVDAWKVLAEIGSGSSVREIADRLGTTEFWTARTTAHLVGADLVTLRSEHTSTGEPAYPDAGTTPSDQHPEYEDRPQESVAPEADDSRSDIRDSEPDFETHRAEPEQVGASADTDEETDSDESWWQEPEDGNEPAEDIDERTPEVVSEGLLQIPQVDASDEEDHDPSDGEDQGVEGDTEAFLEKVFSELDSSDSEAEEGHGLLRRRRMGTLRDFSSDS